VPAGKLCEGGNSGGLENAGRSRLVGLTFFAGYVLILVLVLLILAGVIGLAMGVSLFAVLALVALAAGALGRLSGP